MSFFLSKSREMSLVRNRWSIYYPFMTMPHGMLPAFVHRRATRLRTLTCPLPASDALIDDGDTAR